MPLQPGAATPSSPAAGTVSESAGGIYRPLWQTYDKAMSRYGVATFAFELHHIRRKRHHLYCLQTRAIKTDVIAAELRSVSDLDLL